MSNSQTPSSNSNPNPNADSNSAHFTADPLLKPGTFINPTPTGDGDTIVGQPETIRPPQRTAEETANVTPRTGSGRKRPQEPMDWLPSGWKVETKERTTGASAGMVDKYYYELATGRRFRSKKEVMNYLQTGDVPSKRRNYSDGKKPESLEMKKRTSIENFDFSNPPEKVSWVLKDASADTWTAILDGKEVLESTRQEWAEVRDHVLGSGAQNSI